MWRGVVQRPGDQLALPGPPAGPAQQRRRDAARVVSDRAGDGDHLGEAGTAAAGEQVPGTPGGTAAAGAVIQFYVVEYQLSTGVDVIVPYTLTLMGGKVVAVE